jgi:hypothetical protein
LGAFSRGFFYLGVLLNMNDSSITMVTNLPPLGSDFSTSNSVAFAKSPRGQQSTHLHRHQHPHRFSSTRRRPSRRRHHDIWSPPDRSARRGTLPRRRSDRLETADSLTDSSGSTHPTFRPNLNASNDSAAHHLLAQPHESYRIPTNLETLNQNQMLFHLKKCQKHEQRLHEILQNATDVDPDLDNILLALNLQDENRELRGRNALLIEAEKSLKFELRAERDRARIFKESCDEFGSKHFGIQKILNKDNAELASKIGGLLQRNVELERQNGIKEEHMKSLITVNSKAHQKRAQMEKEAAGIKDKLLSLEQQIVDEADAMTGLKHENWTLREQLKDQEEHISKTCAEAEEITVKLHEKQAELLDAQNQLRTAQDQIQYFMRRIGAALPYLQELANLHHFMETGITIAPRPPLEITASDTQSTDSTPFRSLSSTDLLSPSGISGQIDITSQVTSAEIRPLHSNSSPIMQTAKMTPDSYQVSGLSQVMVKSPRNSKTNANLEHGKRNGSRSPDSQSVTIRSSPTLVAYHSTPQHKAIGSKRVASRSPADKSRAKRPLGVSSDSANIQTRTEAIISSADAHLAPVHNPPSLSGTSFRRGSAGRVVGPAAALHVSKVDITTDVPAEAFIAYKCKALDRSDGQIYERPSHILHADVLKKVREQLAACKSHLCPSSRNQANYYRRVQGTANRYRLADRGQ